MLLNGLMNHLKTNPPTPNNLLCRILLKYCWTVNLIGFLMANPSGWEVCGGEDGFHWKQMHADARTQTHTSTSGLKLCEGGHPDWLAHFCQRLQTAVSLKKQNLWSIMDRLENSYMQPKFGKLPLLYLLIYIIFLVVKNKIPINRTRCHFQAAEIEQSSIWACAMRPTQ